jgi:hypothetical protein
MASIAIFDLYVAGSELFADSESFLRELSGGELQIQGGIINPDPTSVHSIYLPDVFSIIY